MNRKQLIYLNKWLNKHNRKPLIIRGARQVGKSTLINLLAQQQNSDLAAINLERHLDPQGALTQAFSYKDPKQIIDILEALPGINNISPESILFLDEIQAVPEAIPTLRYFYEEMNEIPLVAAGSLLEFALSQHPFSMPVGRVEYLHMGPMTFSEFLDALNEKKLLSIIQNFEIGNNINLLIHQRMIELLRIYFFVGGMPEAVNAYVHSKRLKDVSSIHNGIIETYRDDFPKYIGSRNLSRIQQVFNYAARNIGKKVKYSQFSQQDKSSTIKADIELLCMARVLSKVIHSHCSGLPLQAGIEEKVYKLIFLDVGLMNAICGLNWNTLSQMNNTHLVNEGVIAEQFIGQHLQDILYNSPNRELTYWLREGRSSNADVDYVMAINGKIIPIEIKSGASGSLKSLHQFVAEKNVSTALRFDSGLPSTQTINTKIRKKDKTCDLNYQLISLPLYLVERLPELNL